MSKRGVAQPGSAPVLGTGGRRFESCRPDSISLSLSQTFSKAQAGCSAAR